MKKSAKAAVAATAVAALYGAAAYGVTRTLMDVAMKREAPKAFKNKGSAQFTGEKRDEPYREAQRAAAKKLASSETETVLLENREGLTLVGHLRECEKAKRLVIAFHGWRSAWYRDFGLVSDFLEREKCSVLYVEQRAQNESEGNYIGFGLTERYGVFAFAQMAHERQSVAVFKQHRLRFRRGKPVRRRFLRLAVKLVMALPREMVAAFML